jgi:hypothetical protein
MPTKMTVESFNKLSWLVIEKALNGIKDGHRTYKETVTIDIPKDIYKSKLAEMWLFQTSETITHLIEFVTNLFYEELCNCQDNNPYIIQAQKEFDQERINAYNDQERGTRS